MVKNRDRWTVEVVHRDRSLSVAGRTGRVRLPAAYLASHVELAYAETSHANQGRTVDRSLLYLDGPTGASGATSRLPRVGSPTTPTWRSAEIGRSLTSARYEPDAQRQRLARLTTGRNVTAQSIAQHEAQLD